MKCIRCRLQADVSFLSAHNLMDYSLLVGLEQLPSITASNASINVVPINFSESLDTGENMMSGSMKESALTQSMLQIYERMRV